MGFRNGAYARVWEITPKTDKVTNGKISISMKNQTTGGYDTKFNEYVSFLGPNCAAKAKMLKKGDSIKLGEVDAETRWDSQKQQKFYSWKIFSFEPANFQGAGNPNAGNMPPAPTNPVYEGVSDDMDEEGLPF